MKSVNVVLVGKTGVGKSATGNMLMNMKVFTEAPRVQASKTYTSDCKIATLEMDGIKLNITDTPGIFDGKKRNLIDNYTSIKKAVKSLEGKAHVFVFVVNMHAPSFDTWKLFVVSVCVCVGGGGLRVWRGGRCTCARAYVRA